jgi:homopolymeric O-antigen transport system ATP-binding protein
MKLLTKPETRPDYYPDIHNDRVILQNVSVCYRLPRERFRTIKEYAIRYIQRRLEYVEFWALHDINLKIRRGEVLGVIGANGAGKSTLLKVISRVLYPTQGRMWTCGRVAPLLELSAGFHPELTGRENIFLNGSLLGFSRKEMEARFERIVDFAGLWEFIEVPVRTYSTGMVGRLGFAIATDVNPDILLIDEVLSVGDAEFANKAQTRIAEFCSADIAIVIVTHALDRIKEMCQRVIWLEHGRIVAEGDPATVIDMYLASRKIKPTLTLE